MTELIRRIEDLTPEELKKERKKRLAKLSKLVDLSHEIAEEMAWFEHERSAVRMSLKDKSDAYIEDSVHGIESLYYSPVDGRWYDISIKKRPST